MWCATQPGDDACTCSTLSGPEGVVGDQHGGNLQSLTARGDALRRGGGEPRVHQVGDLAGMVKLSASMSASVQPTRRVAQARGGDWLWRTECAIPRISGVVVIDL
jgi:hypothetical protein